MRRKVIAAAIALSMVAAPAIGDESPVQQPHGLMDKSPQERPQQLSFWLGFPFYSYYYGYYGAYGVALGVRYAIPLVKNGFIPQINNSFEIEFGGTLGFLNEYPYPLGWWIDIPVEVRWTFHITQLISAYPKLALGIRYQVPPGVYACPGPYCACPGPYCPGLAPYYDAALGVMFDVTKAISLRVELAVQGLRLGLGINF